MLIDGHSMAFRAFFALPAKNFSTKGGQATNSVYGFLRMLSLLIQQEQPTHLGVVFDVGRPAYRTEKFPEYKAQRDPTPPEFKGQVPLLKEVLTALGVATLEKPDYEADDVIATLATQAREGSFDTLIVSGDRDSYQLINETTTVLYPQKGVSNMDRTTPEFLLHKQGVTPEQYPDYAALRGDSSDNLPNVPGVGPATAKKWINLYGSLEGLIEHADELKGKAATAFRERIDQVRLNRELTEMVRDLELPLAPDDLTLKTPDAVRVGELFDSLEFGSKLRTTIKEVFDLNFEGLAEREQVAIVLDDEPLEQWLQNRSETPVGVWVSGHATPGRGSADVVAFADAQHHAKVCTNEQLGQRDRDVLVQWFASSAPKCFHGAKAAYHMLAEGDTSFRLRGLVHDTELAAYLNRPGQRTFALEDVYQRHLEGSLRPLDVEGEADSKADAQGQGCLFPLPDPTLHAERAAAVMELSAKLTEELKDIEAFELYRDLELPLTLALARMEAAGIAVDRDILEEELAAYTEQALDAQARARSLVDREDLNLSSPKQLQEVLFVQLGLPKTKKIKTGYSTAAKEIEALSAKQHHPFLDVLIEYRELQKMKTTIEGLIAAVTDEGRIHTRFQQTITSTGRLSSVDPNLQNIPVRTEAGRRIRAAFVVGEGYEQLLTADYSQIEMRVMAHLSQDVGLIEAYNTGEDLHNYVGSKVFDVPVTEVTPELRRRVKAMSYGLVYGLSAFGLSQQLGIPAGEAKRIMEQYFERFGGVKAYLDSVVEQARELGYTATLFGRRRYLPELQSSNRVARENAERAALNAPIQGTAADIIKVAMLRVDDALQAMQANSRVLLQVHDELVVEVAPGELAKVRELVEREMDAAISLKVPLEVASGAGHDWNEAAH